MFRFEAAVVFAVPKVPDAQAAYESANTLQAAMLAGVNFMLHATGWLEGGLVMGYEKFILDADQAGILQTFLSGIDTTENGQAIDAVREVGAGKSLSWLRLIRKQISRQHSTVQQWLTTIALNNGRQMEVCKHRNAPTKFGNKCLKTTNCRNLTLA